MSNIKMTKARRRIKPVTLIQWRERMGYSQRDAAEAVGCSRRAWMMWESGQTRVPRYIGLALAALALDMSPYGMPSEEEQAGKDR